MQDQSLKSWTQRTSLVAAVFFVAALIVRLVYIHQFSDSSLFDPTIMGVDAKRFDEAAQAMASGTWLPGGVFQFMPGYGYFLGIIYSIFGRNLTVAYIVQSLLGAGSVVLLYILAKRIADNRVAWIAAIGGVFSQMLVFHVGMLTGEMLAIFLMLACLLLLSAAVDSRSFKYFLIAGITAGLGILCRGTFALFIILFIPWYAIVERKHLLKCVLPNLVALILGTALMIAPVTIKNYVMGDDFVLVTAHGGVTHYLGYNPHARGSYRPEKLLGPDFEGMYANAEKIAEKEAGRELKPSEISAYWRNKATSYARENPVHAMKLAGEKIFLFFHNFEFTDVVHLASVEKHSWLLKYCLMPTGLFVPFAILGIGLAIRRKRFGPVYLFMMAALISIVIVHINARYRLMAVPLFLLFAAYALVWFKENYKSKTRLLLGIAVIVIGFFTVFMPIDTSLDRSLHTFEVGKMYYRSGKMELAEKQFRKAIELNPATIRSRLFLGDILRMSNRLDEADRQIRQLLQIDPDNPKAINQLGVLSYLRGNKQGALDYWHRSLEIDPDQPKLRKIIEKVKREM